MMTSDSKDALREFVRDRSESAFRTLVRRHSPMVYNAALRKLGGNRTAAQDVTQEVFTHLARKASRLEGVVLGGWLYRQTCRRAANHVRAESRRKRREFVAMEQSSLSTSLDPTIANSLLGALDEALLALPATDRNALILRYFEGREFKPLGNELGLSEEAARKRVTRALERLGGNLKRKGIAVGSASIGTAMQGLAAFPVPATMVSKVSIAAVDAATTTAPTALLALLKPVAAGVIATSLAAGSALALRPPAEEPAAAGEMTRTSMALQDRRTARVTDPFPEIPTLEQILAEIKRVKSGPGNVLTALRLRVVLKKIGIPQIPEFIALANQRLNQAEREEIYQPLLDLWWNVDPDAATTFVLVERVDGQIKAGGETYLVGEYFRRWAEKDPHGTEAWLLRHWNDEILGKEYSGGRFRNFLSMWIAGNWFSQRDIPALFEFAGRLPTPTDQAAALKAIAGMAPFHSMRPYSDSHKTLWDEFYKALEKFPEASLRRELVRGFWKNLGEEQPGKVRDIYAFINPADPFEASLGLLGVRRIEGQPVRVLSGGISNTPEPVTDRETREAAAMEAGLAGGLSRAQALTAIGEVLTEVMTAREFFAWFDSHQDEIELDDLLAAKAATKAIGLGYTRGEEMEAIDWASRISNDERRRIVSRGVFRRLLSRFPEIARNHLNHDLVPGDLLTEFQSILDETL